MTTLVAQSTNKRVWISTNGTGWTDITDSGAPSNISYGVGVVNDTIIALWATTGSPGSLLPRLAPVSSPTSWSDGTSFTLPTGTPTDVASRVSFMGTALLIYSSIGSGTTVKRLLKVDDTGVISDITPASPGYLSGTSFPQADYNPTSGRWIIGGRTNSGGNDKVWYSDNDGTSWTATDDPSGANWGAPGGSTVYDIANDVWIRSNNPFGGTDSWILYTSADDGATWSYQFLGTGSLGNGHLFYKSGSVYALVGAGSPFFQLWSSSDGGSSWTDVSTGSDYDSEVAGNWQEVFGDTASNGLYLIGGAGTIPPLQRSANNGANWVEVLDPGNAVGLGGASTDGIEHIGHSAITAPAAGPAPYVGIYVEGTIGCGDVTYSFDYSGTTGLIDLTYVSGDAAGQWSLTSPTSFDVIYDGAGDTGANKWIHVIITVTPWGAGGVEHVSFKSDGTEISNAYDLDTIGSGDVFPDATQSWTFEAVDFAGTSDVTGTLRIQGCQAPPS